MTGLLVSAVGWVLVAVGLVVTFGVWLLIPVGVVTFVAGVLVDWEAVRAEHR